MNLLSFDVETQGTKPEYALQPWRAATGDFWLSTAAWSYRDDVRGWKSVGKMRPSTADLIRILMAASRYFERIVGWNVTFDIACLIALGLEEQVFKCKWLDGMRVWRHAFIEPEYELARAKKKSYRLKPDAIKEVCPDLLEYEEGIDYQTQDPVILKKLLEYNKLDTIAAARCTEHFWNLLTPRQQTACLIEADCLPHVARANVLGMHVDTERLAELDRLYCAKADAIATELAPLGVTPTLVRSPDQMKKLLFETWKLPMIGSKGKIDSTDKTVLHELSFIDPRAKKLREFREALNLHSKFIASIRKSLDYSGNSRTYPQAIVFGTYTGRMTYASTQKSDDR